MVLKSRRNRQMLFAIQEAKKLPENDNLRKIHNQFEQHNSGEQHTGRQRSDSAEPYVVGFPKSIIFVATVPPEQLQDICFLLRFHKAGRSCSPRLEKRSLFSPPPPCAKSMARGFRCLRAAIRATRPESRQHF